MSQEISDELIKKIRYYVKKYNSKIDAANKFGMQTPQPLHFSSSISIIFLFAIMLPYDFQSPWTLQYSRASILSAFISNSACGLSPGFKNFL